MGLLCQFQLSLLKFLYLLFLKFSIQKFFVPTFLWFWIRNITHCPAIATKRLGMILHLHFWFSLTVNHTSADFFHFAQLSNDLSFPNPST
jgi:hypothetical protein